MATEGFKRRLTSIFSADVVGYSRLMDEDEESTVKTLENYMGAMFSLIKQHRERVVDSPRQLLKCIECFKSTHRTQERPGTQMNYIGVDWCDCSNVRH